MLIPLWPYEIQFVPLCSKYGINFQSHSLAYGIKLATTRGAKLSKIQEGGWRGNRRIGSIFKRIHFLAFPRKAIKKGL